jgi:hypothetical protein
MKTIIIIFEIISTFFCATVIKGSKQLVCFNTEPSNAAVFIDGNYLDQSPFYTKLKANKNYVIDLVADSTHYERVYLKRKMCKGFLIADIIMAHTFYLAPFIIVDASFGSWFRLDNPYVFRKLK